VSLTKERRIERVEEKDLDEIYFLEIECFGDDAYPKSFFEYVLRDRETIFLKALVRGELAGFIVGRYFKKLGIGQVYSIDVAEKFRRRGIGSALLREFEKELSKLGAREVVLQVSVDNIPAIRLYEKNGYRIVGRIRGYYGKNRDAYEARKRLG